MHIAQEYTSWAIGILKDMISIPTINPPGINYDKFTNYVSKVMKVLGMDVDIIEVPKDLVSSKCDECKDYPRFIIIGRIGSGRPIVHFNGHYDVVPPGEGWRLDPFKGYIENNKVYGRGAVDMKGGIASIFLALKVFANIYKEFNGTIEVALVPDEEIGGETGTGYMLQTMNHLPNYAIIAEGSGSSNIWIGHKGALWGYIEVMGMQSHGSTPWRGVNAFEYMIKIASKFIEMHNEITYGRVSRYDYGDPEGSRPTLNVGGEVKGSTKINIVPGYYAFSFDRRVVPEESLELVENEIKNIVENLAKQFPQVKIGLKIVTRLKPALTNENVTLVKIFEESIERIVGTKPRKIVCLGGLDMHYYTEKGIETITYGPGPEENAHVVNEYVLIDELVDVAKVYVNALSKLLGNKRG